MAEQHEEPAYAKAYEYRVRSEHRRGMVAHAAALLDRLAVAPDGGDGPGLGFADVESHPEGGGPHPEVEEAVVPALIAAAGYLAAVFRLERAALFSGADDPTDDRDEEA